MYLEPWQAIGLAFIAAIIGGAITRAALRRQFAALHQQFIIAGDMQADIKSELERKASRFEVEEAADRIVDRLDPEKRREREQRRLQATIPGYGAPR